MMKLVVFAALVAYASAGLIPLDDGIGLGGIGLGGIGLGGIALSPKVISAPIAVKAGAVSYQNSNLLSLNPTPVVTKAIAAPIVTKVAAPIGVLGVDGHLGLGGLGLGGIGLGYGK